jgi:hypothetical protein
MKHLATLQQSIETLRESVEAFQGREKKGWGFVHGTLTFGPSVKNKAGVQLTLVGTSTEGEAVTKNAETSPQGSYLFVNVPPGSYRLRANRTDLEPETSDFR